MARETLFKYRALNDWKFLLDILINKRLYAAPYHDLNDPMEGRYYHFGRDVKRAYRKAIRNTKREWRICSLTQNPTSSIMWSYYAGGHTGVVLGLAVRGQSGQPPMIRKVGYDQGVGIQKGFGNRSAADLAIEILSQKQMAWEHEDEVRVFSREPFVPIDLKSVRLGCKIAPADEELIRKTVRKTCKGVRVTKAERKHFREPVDF